MRDDDSETLALPGVGLHMEARWFPVLVATWFGTVSVRAVEHYVAWLERMGARAEVEGTRLVILGDITRLEQRPGPDVRAAMAAAIDGLVTRHPKRFLGGSTIVGQPIMRAVLLMVLALTRRSLDMRPVKDLGEGIARSFALLEAAGIPRPPGLDAATYRTPARPR